MKTLRFVFSDQLSHSLSSFDRMSSNDTVMLCELMEEVTFVQHHPKKIALWLASMRHFSDELRAKQITVRYIELKNPSNTQNLTQEVLRAVQDLNIERIIMTEPSEYRLKVLVDSWSTLFNIPVDICIDRRFLCSIEDFKIWAGSKKQYIMEYFYRDMRKKYHILMDSQSQPIGDQWNYDKDNRKPPSAHMKSIKRISHKKSQILKDVLQLVSEHFHEHFGDLNPFYYAVTREQALMELDHFIENVLGHFGDYQDAMVQGEPYLYHSLLASYVNMGLLEPLEMCKKAQEAFFKGYVSIQCAEGFIRQILGWREFIRGIYWLKMPQYAQMNYLDAVRPVPHFYWGGPTQMACIKEAVDHTKKHAYSHHIQRLMITGNFALLAGLDVQQMQDWYLCVYSDAYEWVEMPNTLGMALFGDGGIVGTKPYAASGQYIHRMSNFCKDCYYDVKEMTGQKACPFNALYWNFMAQNREKLETNPRLGFMYKTWDRFSEEKKDAIILRSIDILKMMNEGLL